MERRSYLPIPNSSRAQIRHEGGYITGRAEKRQEQQGSPASARRAAASLVWPKVVSGGSILGAHLALNWERYNGSAADFEAAASKILDFVRFDARNHIARRIPFLAPFRFLLKL